MRALRGDLTGARDDLRRAGTLADGPTRALVGARQAQLAVGADDLHRADDLAQLALVQAGNDARARAETLSVAAVVDMNLHRRDRAAARSRDALKLFEVLGDARGAARVIDVQAMATFLDGNVTAAVDAFGRVAACFEAAGQLLLAITPRSTRGHALVFHHRAAEGLQETDAALALAVALGNADGEAFACWHRSEALTAVGRLEEAVATAARGLTIAERIGHRGWTVTARLGLGLAYAAGGDDGAAVDEFGAALALSEHLPLFGCWAAARLARARTRMGMLDEAQRLIDLARRIGPPLGQYEVRLADGELAVVSDRPDAEAVVAPALRDAWAGGHLVSAVALRDLTPVGR